jgi:hypothetical protein
LEQDTLEGVLSVEVFAAPFEPKVVKQEASEDVEGLSSVGEIARVIAVEVRGVVFLFEDGFPKENERPGDVEVVGRLPFTTNAEEGFPGLLGGGTFHEAVLGGL